MIISSPIIPAGDAAEITDLWGMPSAFLADWSGGMTMRTVWTTDVKKAYDKTESRHGTRTRPRRIIEYPVYGFGEVDIRLIRSAMARMTRARVLAPLYCDQTILDQTVFFRFQRTLDGDGGAIIADSGRVTLDLTDYATLPWTASHDGIVVITGPTDNITTATTAPVYTGMTLTAPGLATYTIPDDAIIVAQTSGDLTTTGDYSRRFTGPSSNFNLIYGTGAGITASTVAGVTGHTLLSWAGVTRAALDAKGWVDADNVGSFRIWLIPAGPSTVSVELPEPITLICDTTGRRFFAGGRVLIATPRADESRMTEYHVAEIGNVGDGYIALAEGDFEIAAGAKIYPLIEGRPTLEANADVITGKIIRAVLRVTEDVGPSQLPASHDTTAPEGMATLDGIPVFPFYMGEGLEIGYAADENVQPSGLTEVIQIRGPRPLVQGSGTFTMISRADAFDMIKLFDSRCGGLAPFLMPSPTNDLVLDALSGTSIDVQAVGGENDWANHTHLAIQLQDGSYEVRRIVSVSRDVDIDTVIINAAFDASIGDIQRVTVATMSVFASDELVEQWITDEVATFSIAFREVVDADSDFIAPSINTDTEFTPPAPDRGTTGCGPPVTPCEELQLKVIRFIGEVSDTFEAVDFSCYYDAGTGSWYENIGEDIFADRKRMNITCGEGGLIITVGPQQTIACGFGTVGWRTPAAIPASEGEIVLSGFSLNVGFCGEPPSNFINGTITFEDPP